MRRIACILLGVCLTMLCVGCVQTPSVVGCWVNDDPDTYYFQLYEDGTCMMFDSTDRWVSSGTYTAEDDGIHFETDTGNFTWVKTDGGMLFESGGHAIVYHLQEN